MSNSKDDEVKKSGMILRTDVFYEPEYRELCLQQLNMYNDFISILEGKFEGWTEIWQKQG